MTNDSVSKICEFWQQGSHEPTRFNGEDLRSRMNKFERTIRRRNLREYVAAGLVIGVFAYYGWVFPTLLLRIGCGLLILGTAYVAYQLHRKASARPAPAEMGLRNCVQFQRSELERQRDALRAVWSWYLSPFLPGMSLFLFGLFQFTKNVTEAAGRTKGHTMWCTPSAPAQLLRASLWLLVASGWSSWPSGCSIGERRMSSRSKSTTSIGSPRMRTRFQGGPSISQGCILRPCASRLICSAACG